MVAEFPGSCQRHPRMSSPKKERKNQDNNEERQKAYLGLIKCAIVNNAPSKTQVPPTTT